jgi:hypothetical protein
MPLDGQGVGVDRAEIAGLATAPVVRFVEALVFVVYRDAPAIALATRDVALAARTDRIAIGGIGA